ncbi:DUF3892 domain-containing protein [Pseudomonas putida]|uniref:DUF3892 domain-containing protein n=1 Tax=Pseudomonas putida TaxID=303 RepID=UPI0015775AC8|nr:DUF3892 domain-containing protein [Pseudomonas putida]NTY90447.1 DUF3892 domain-containing protein [Pseudomonas putida]NTY98989.1 DUF3892 domain-containing protein [Pseudomonas putida]NTZ21272.1 DUF3892 domain-containing protein [Pseudomonas putida]NTZ53209.1 DUF3892 domain-containing protein [Pseudomonas putida]NTZ65141.1 DUF3892 domain-containing protein [Pseudomonas putida]
MAADFYISGIRRDKPGGHIQQVQLIKDGTNKRLTSDRAFVADLINLGQTTFQTIFWDKDKWRFGEHVHTVDGEFLATDRNARKEDNLESLPTF